jgi:hypothetical protein
MGMESVADRAYRRKQERRARQDARRANRASKATHVSHLSLSPCTHTALWGPPSEWSPVCQLVDFGVFETAVHLSSFDCTCDSGNANIKGHLICEIWYFRHS